METIEVKKCCYLCTNLYNKEKCPLFKTYNTAEYYGDTTFNEVAKYQVFCDKYETNKYIIDL